MNVRNLLHGLVAVTSALCAMPTPAEAPKKPRALLITGLGTTDPDHPQHILTHGFYNDKIAEILDGIVDVTVTDDLSMLNDAALRDYDVVLNNSFLLDPTYEQLDAFHRYIEQGNAYMALHAGLVSFLNSDRYDRMMGGRFIGHDPVKTFTVETFVDGFGLAHTAPTAHPIARGIANFTTRDELYVVQTNTADLEVIARAESHPIVWWRRWEKGSVLAFALGHADYSLESEGYQALLQNSVRWLVGYPIMEPIRERVFPADSAPVDDYIDLDEVSHHHDDAPLKYTLSSSSPDLIQATIDPNNRIDLTFAPGRQGKALITVHSEDPDGLTDSTELEITIRKRGTGNLSAYHGAGTHTSSNEPRFSTLDPALATDGDPATRWSSSYGDDNWIYVDLGAIYPVDRVRLIWEGAHAKKYEIQVSNDASAWRTVHAVSEGGGGTEEIRFDAVNARYVRMLGLQRATRYGYSLYEFEIYGAAPD